MEGADKPYGIAPCSSSRANLFQAGDLPSFLGRRDYVADVINTPKNPSTSGYNIDNLFTPNGLMVEERQFSLRASRASLSQSIKTMCI